MSMSPFCLFRVKPVPSEKDSGSYGVLAGPSQSLIAGGNVNYALPLKLPPNVKFSPVRVTC